MPNDQYLPYLLNSSMGRKKTNDWKNRDGVVYYTSDNFSFDNNDENAEETLSSDKQRLRVELDKKARGGKKVTLITGFVGSDDDLKALGRLVKGKCGVGGSTKNGEIIVQGDFRKKIGEILEKEDYRVKVI